MFLLLGAAAVLGGFLSLQRWAVTLVNRRAAPPWAQWALLWCGLPMGYGALITVNCLIGSFKAVAHVDPAEKANVLSASIAESFAAGSLFFVPPPLLWLACLVYFTARRRPAASS